MNRQNPEYINLNYLNEISEGDNQLISEMIDIFISEVPSYLKMMHKYQEDKDWDALGKLAHKAKASSSIMGMGQLTNELKDLELLAKENREPGLYLALVKRIENQFNSAIKELKLISKTL